MKPGRLKDVLNFAIPLLAFLAILSVSYLGILDNYELETLDFRFLLRPHIQTTDKIVLIDIGEDTIAKLGRFPFDRAYHALLVKALSEAKARYIVFDIFFSEPAEHDLELEDAIMRAGTVYLPYVFDLDTRKRSGAIYQAKGYIARNLEDLTRAAKGAGHINIAPDPDGKYRRIPLYIQYGDRLYPYVSFLMSLNYLGLDQKNINLTPGRRISLGSGVNVPLDEQSNMMVNFSGRWSDGDYRHYSYVDILQSYTAMLNGEKPNIDLAVFKDKVCIIGLTAAGTCDLHPTPFETRYPGVGIHAEVFNSILTRNFISRASKAINLLILVILSLLVSFVTMKTRPVKMFSILLGMIAIFALIGILLFNLSGIWIDIFYPAAIMVLLYLALTLYKYIGEWKRRLVLDNELDIAKKIQESFLPKRLPGTSSIDIAATMFTARKVGGDLYDFLEFGPDTLGLMIGDVSGKGIPASLFMAMVIAKFKSLAGPGSRPEELLSNLNSTLVRESSSNLFVTVFYSIFDFKTGSVAYANGGHLPAIYTGPGKELKFLDVDEGMPLGLMDGAYSGRSVDFEKGDIFVFYTDGITEAMNARSEMYGKERLSAVIESHKELSSKALLDIIERDVRRFEPKTTQHDDMTLIVMRII